MDDARTESTQTGPVEGYFHPESLVIEVLTDRPEPTSAVIRQPGTNDSWLSRCVFHEVVHWWQQLGQAFLIRHTAERWDRLLEFESTGTLPPKGPYQETFVRENESLGFSAQDLHEAFARYWDVHAFDPVQLIDREYERRQKLGETLTWFGKPVDDYEAFRQDVLRRRHLGSERYTEAAYTMAMIDLGGGYAQPYRHIVDALGKERAGVAFPIVTHFAFQTPDPAHFYAAFVEVLSDGSETPLRSAPVETLWTYYYVPFRDAFEQVMAEAGESLLSPVEELATSSLCDHPGYGDVLGELRHARESLPGTMMIVGEELEFGAWLLTLRDLFAHFGDEDLRAERFPGLRTRSDGDLLLDLLFALPGVRTYRDILYQKFPPVVVRFYDDETWLLGAVDRAEFPEVYEWRDDPPKFESMAADALELDEARKRLERHERYGI